MDPLLTNREILIRAIREVLGVAAYFEKDLETRRSYILEATRISLRLLEVQKQIDDRYPNER